MTPRKIIFYTRPWEVHFHMALAASLRESYPAAQVLFASFFAQAIDLAHRKGFETLYFPVALKAARGNVVSNERLREIDMFCRKEYLGLNAMLNTERFLPCDREGARAFLHEHITVLDAIVEKQTLSVSSMYDHFVYLAGGMLAQEKGGAHFAFVGCGVPAGRVIGLRTPWETWENRQLTEDAAALLARAKEELDLPSEVRIEYMSKPKRKEKRTLLSRALEANRTSFRKYLFERHDVRAGSYFPPPKSRWPMTLVRAPWKKLRQMRTIPAPWDVQSEHQLKKIEGRCVFLALHMEPEATIFMYSPRWRNQIEECRVVSEALPMGYILLVKENPKMLGRRPKGYYEAIRRFNNVLLVSDRVPSAALINHSVAVVSLAGTVTMEARLKGKPAFCFGRPPFHRMANVVGAELLDALGQFDKEAYPDDRSALFAAWTRWVRGTFAARASRQLFESETGLRVLDFSDGNVERYYEFISGCLHVPSEAATTEQHILHQ